MSRVFSGAWDTVVSACILIVLLYFLLASGDLFLRKLIKVLPSFRDKKLAVEIARRLEDHISRYLLTITMIYAAWAPLSGRRCGSSACRAPCCGASWPPSSITFPTSAQRREFGGCHGELSHIPVTNACAYRAGNLSCDLHHRRTIHLADHPGQSGSR